MSNRNKALLAIILSAIFGGGNAVFNKLGLKEIPVFLFILLRFILGALILLPFIVREKINFDKNLKNLFLVSLLATTNIILFSFGVRLTSANIATMLYTCTPIVMAILLFIIYREKITPQKITGILLGFIGTFIIVILPLLDNKIKLQSNLWGNIIIFSGVICFSLYGVLSKSLQKHYSPKFVSFVFFLTAMLVVIPLSAVDMINHPFWWQVSKDAWVGLIYVGIFGAIGLYILFQYAIKYGSPVIASMNSYLQPITGVIWAFLLLGEKITVSFLLAALLTITGVYLVTKNNDK